MRFGVLLATFEMYPFAKVGGLGDYCYSLPLALKEHDVDMRVIMPRHGCIPAKFQENLTTVLSFGVEMSTGLIPCTVLYTEGPGGVPVYFVDIPAYFSQNSVYGDEKNQAERYIAFNKAVLRFLLESDFRPEIVQCNDWHTGLIPILLKISPTFTSIRDRVTTIATIHTMIYQGVFSRDEVLPHIDIDWETLVVSGADFYDQLNFLKVSLVYADHINTVSLNYAKEITRIRNIDPLDRLLMSRRKEVSGIQNGIDLQINDPRNDARLYERFGADSHVQGKRENKSKLQQELKLEVDPAIPLFVIVSRLAIVKGLDLVTEIVGALEKDKLQLIIVGDGLPYFDACFQKAARENPGKISYSPFNEALAARTYAAADFFMMPSHSESCGTSHLIGMRYGAVPIVRAVGGLPNSVVDIDRENGKGNGFLFNYANAAEMVFTIRRAMTLFEEKSSLHRLIRRAMGADIGWKRSAKKYVKLYTRVLTTKAALVAS